MSSSLSNETNDEAGSCLPNVVVAQKQRLLQLRSVSVVDAGVSSLSKSKSDFSSSRVLSMDDDAVIAAPSVEVGQTTSTSSDFPTHIPVEDNTSRTCNRTSKAGDIGDVSVEVEEDNYVEVTSNDNGKVEDSVDDDESEYEYEDDDESPFSGFLMASSNFTGASAQGSSAPSSSAQIIEEDVAPAKAVPSSYASSPDEDDDAPRKNKWREPSRAAVSMSLRAQQETSGSKRRLAQDLYRIMSQDTQVAGFSLAPQSEDSMDKWTIKLFQFDSCSNLAKDMMVLGIEHVELEMLFPEQYPFEPPFVRVVKPRFKRQTGFVMNGALCMELLTKDGWNPVNDIESVIVSIRSLLVVGDGRLQAASELSKARYDGLLKAAELERDEDGEEGPKAKKARLENQKVQAGSYSSNEAKSAYSHLSDYHKKKGWDTSGWWAKKG
jgi:ubiquitin-protein ligase